MTTTVHIGCGAGFANDRPDAALALANDSPVATADASLFFELLAERTLAEAQLRRLNDAQSGYALRLFDFLEPVLETCPDAGIAIVTNGGAAHPTAAATRLRQQLQGTAHASARIACVLGDDLLGSDIDLQQWLPAQLDGEVVSVNVHSGADGIVQALDQAPTSSSAAESPTPAWRWGRCAMPSAGRPMTGIASPRPRQLATCSNAAPRSAVATSLIPA